MYRHNTSRCPSCSGNIYSPATTATATTDTIYYHSYEHICSSLKLGSTYSNNIWKMGKNKEFFTPQ